MWICPAPGCGLPVNKPGRCAKHYISPSDHGKEWRAAHPAEVEEYNRRRRKRRDGE
jgi:hypothetical protein